MCAFRVLEVHVKEQECVTTSLMTSWCVGHIEHSVLKERKKKCSHRMCVCSCTRLSRCTQKAQLDTAAWTDTHKCRLPMRQMRSERSHIKQPNLSCFAFIAPVHFHNALKPPLRREGDMERRAERWGGGVERNGDTQGERDGKEGRRDKKHSQSNLKLVDVWGCEDTR